MDIVKDFLSELKSLSTYEYFPKLLKLLNYRAIERYGEVWRGMEARSKKAALESAPARHGNRTKRSLCSRVHDFRRSRKNRARSGSKVST